MSNALSLAAVTLTLRNLLDGVATADYSSLPNGARPTAQIEVTTLPPDRVRLPDASRNRLNLFLYHTEMNPAWRNMDMPRRVRPGENGAPPLALNLFYILTAYAENDSELVGQVLLGSAMRVLHDHPLLGREEIADALELSGLADQVERVRITPQPVSLDDLSKLWTGFQSEYRLSAAYQVAAVLIESELPLRAALPVLRRGADDGGTLVVAAPGPSLQRVKEFVEPGLTNPPPHGKPAAELGDVLVLEGSNLGGHEMIGRFRHPRLEAPLSRPLEAERSDTEVRLAIPAAGDPGTPAGWPAGFYTVELEVQRPAPPNWTTNRLPFGLAPMIASLNPTTQPLAALPFDLTVTCTPQTLPAQRPVLLLGDREIQPASVTTPADPDAATTLVFPIADVPQGRYVVRLRVDGVDSVPIDFSVRPPQFDPNQVVEITP